MTGTINDTLGSVFFNNLDLDDVPLSAVTCIYPLSGSYGFLARLLYYISLLVVIFSHRVWYWLVAGAGASAMTYSGTAAVHAFTLVALPRTGTFDLDSIGAYVITSTALILIVPIMSFSETMRRHSVRHILRVWAVLMAAGTACATAALLRSWPVEEPCTSKATGGLLTSPSQLSVATFNCTYSCFPNSHNSTESSRTTFTDFLRSANDTLALQTSTLNVTFLSQIQAEALIIACISITNSIFFLILWTKSKHSNKETEGALVPKYRQLTSIAGWLMLPVGLSPLLLVGNIVVAEMFFRSSEIVKGEPVYAIGQWSVVAAAGLVAIGTAIDRWFLGRDERRGKLEGGEEQSNQVESVPVMQDDGAGKVYSMVYARDSWHSFER
jgi:hypothetical protein